MHIIQPFIVLSTLAVLGQAASVGDDVVASEVTLQDTYQRLSKEGLLEWQDAGASDGSQLAFVPQETISKVKRDLVEERMKTRRDLTATGTDLIKRDGQETIKDADGNDHSVKWYCNNPAGSLGFTVLRTIGGIMACRLLEEFLSSLNTGQWFFRTPPAPPAAPAVKRDLKDYPMDLEIFPRDGAGQRMVVALNKHLAISIRSGMCTGMLAWIIGQVACPANGGGTAGGKIKVKKDGGGFLNWVFGDGEDAMEMEAFAEQT